MLSINMNFLTKEEWYQKFSYMTNPHILQTYEWGDLKSYFGWNSRRIIIDGKPIQILFRKLPLNLSIGYIPKINLDLTNQELWNEIDKICKSNKTFFLKIEPDKFDNFISSSDNGIGFQVGKSIQPQNTIIVDLRGTENEWLKRMKSKTRYNIRLAIKKDIKVVSSDDVDTFYKLMLETGDRDKFGIHSIEYYKLAYQLFKPVGNVALLLAYYQDEPLAGLMVFKSGDRSWYFYGASNNKERNRMPTYLLQFEAMKWAKSQGCLTYDLWGIPDEEEEILESEFDKRSDGLWGVYRFKRGFGGKVLRSAPALDRVYNPILYRVFKLYQKVRGTYL